VFRDPGEGSTRRFNPFGPTGMKGADGRIGKRSEMRFPKNQISRTLERQRMNTRARRVANNSKQSRPATDDEPIELSIRSPQTNTGDHADSVMARERFLKPHERADVGAVMRPPSVIPAGKL